MKTRQQIKAQARQAFKAQYGTAVGLYAFPFLIYLAIAMPIMWPSISRNMEIIQGSMSFEAQVDPGLWASLLMMVAQLAFSVLMVGVAGGFTRVYRGMKAQVGGPFAGLRVNFGRKLGAMAWMRLLIFWWLAPGYALLNVSAMLISAPGSASSGGTLAAAAILSLLGMLLMLGGGVVAIIKALSYSQTVFILAEYPDVRAGDALRLSARMTKGYKADVFAMEWSFFGWMVLGALTFGVLPLLYVNPYMETSLAGQYTELRNRAVNGGVVSLDELSESTMQFPPEPDHADDEG